MTTVTRTPEGFTPLHWLICGVASLGFAFDTYELLMMPLIARPALMELISAAPGSTAFNTWVGALFTIPGIAGGVFGLIGGYLTDMFGRRRVLVWSILLYGFSALASGFATSIWMLLVLRCTTTIGVCVEFVAAVAWLAEIFPEGKRRERVLGFTQAFSSTGGLMVSAAYFLVVTFADLLPAIHGDHSPWRYTLISGVIPAIPLMVIRPFLPESPIWAEKKAAGTLRRPSFLELFRPELRRTTLITALMAALAYSAAYGATLQTPRIVPGLAAVQAMPRAMQEKTIGSAQFLQEMGGLTGRVLLACVAVAIVSRRRVLRVFQIPGLVIMPLAFWAALHSLPLLRITTFLAGVVSVAQFSFWGNYLPRVYPTHLRGTGESFAVNVGGRMVGTTAATVTTTLALFMPGNAATQLAWACGIVGTSVFLLGLIASHWLPEPREGTLRE